MNRILRWLGIRDKQLVVYLACPYSGSPEEVERRMDMFCRAVAHMHSRGIFVMSALFMHYVLKYDPTLGNDWRFWKSYASELIARSDEVHVLCIDGWYESEGVGGEMAIAREMGKPVKMVPAEFAEDW